MRRDHHTGWMVPCSLQPVYAKKYVKWKQEGEVCVDVRLRVFLDWWTVSWRSRGRSRNVYHSLHAGEEFSSVFTCFPSLGCVCVCEKWCGVAYTFYSLFFLFFLLLLLLCISHSPITVGYNREPCKNGYTVEMPYGLWYWGYMSLFYCAADREHMLSCIESNGWRDRDTGWSVELDASIEWRLVGVSTHGDVAFG